MAGHGTYGIINHSIYKTSDGNVYFFELQLQFGGSLRIIVDHMIQIYSDDAWHGMIQ